MNGRRQFLASSALITLAAASGRALAQHKTVPSKTLALTQKEFARAMLNLETGVKGRLGVSIIDTGSGHLYGYRADARFPMCSTFKMLAAAAVLRRVDQGQEQLTRRIVYRREDLQSYSPVTDKHVGGEGMSMEQLCEAAMILSDNTAANLILDSMGGPPAITAFVATLGDQLTRLDRNEPTLNEGTPGDPRDTTTPAAMMANVRRLMLGDGLSPASRARLVDWLERNQTGDKRIRAGLPSTWRVGDKTGTGPHGSTNNVGFIWPPGGMPLLFAIYLTECPAPIAAREAVHAAIGKLIAGSHG